MSSPTYPRKSDEPVPSTSRTAKDEDKDIKKANLTKLFPSCNSSENNENDGQPSTSNSSPSNLGAKEIINICGVDVVLPVTPNKCQKEIISQVITAIKQSKNCLVESPAGTGKTLALLCATLAWQQQEKKSDGLVTITKKERDSEAGCSYVRDSLYQSKRNKLNQNTDQDVTQDSIFRVIYSTKTHNRLEEVVQEFKRTVYAKTCRMSILSSRDYSCIKEFNNTLWASKNDMCRRCIKPSSPSLNKDFNCQYYANYKELNHRTLSPVFDLKQLTSEGKSVGACPHYAAKRMATDAHIVFCPYPYIINPSIRTNMQIHLENNIVIIDDGHNIEEKCRQVASFTFNQHEIEAALKELNTVSNCHLDNDIEDHIDDCPYYIKALHAVLTNWSLWFLEQQHLVKGWDYVWGVKEFMKTLDEQHIGQKDYPDFSKNAEIFSEKLYDDPCMLVGINQDTAILIENLVTVLGHLFKSLGRVREDYKAVIYKLPSDSKVAETKCLSLKILCLNPGFMFADLRVARCVLLASSTLAPFDSVSSELETAFPYTVRPRHDNRVWVGSLGGPRLWCASSMKHETAVQDELGLVVQHVCKITPHGVLCFLASYELMNILLKRWRSTKLWEKLQIIKEVFTEGRTIEDHEMTMNRYYECVGNTRGALLFAVYRGKVAEGMDFKDHQARAVIAVGLPYLPQSDIGVREKMNYNNKYSKDLLGGQEWLEVQTYGDNQMYQITNHDQVLYHNKDPQQKFDISGYQYCFRNMLFKFKKKDLHREISKDLILRAMEEMSK